MKKRAIFFVMILLALGLTGFVSAEKIGINIKNNFLDAGNVNFKITLYDEMNNMIEGDIDFIIKNTYSDVIRQGQTGSGENVNFQIPENSLKGVWEISASNGDVNVRENFVIDEIKKVDIKLETDNLIVTNIGNAFYDKDILIMIGDEAQTAKVNLYIGQTKKIRLTAPRGEYTIKVSPEGSGDADLIFSNVALTGNVVGLERVVEGGFWYRYPIISLFLSVLLLVTVTITVLKIHQKVSKK